MMSVEIVGIRELSMDEWDRVGGGAFVDEVAPIVNMINSPSAQLLGLLGAMSGDNFQAPQDCSIPDYGLTNISISADEIANGASWTAVQCGSYDCWSLTMDGETNIQSSWVTINGQSAGTSAGSTCP
jgi:hypothetical protein